MPAQCAPKHSHVKPLLFTAFAILLSACGGGGSGGTDASPPGAGATTLSGSVGDGPIVDATVTVSDAAGTVVASARSDNEANYTITIPADTPYPLTVAASGGTDIVTNAAPSFTMVSAVLNRGANVANINPFSTLIIKTAANMPGGLTATNLSVAQSRVLQELGFGLDSSLFPDPIGTSVTNDNVVNVIKSSEALAELIRRIRSSLSAAGLSLTAEEILDTLAADLTDGALDGVGTGANPRVAATATIAGARIAIESLVNRLEVDQSSATARLDAAIRLTAPDATQATKDVTINADLVSQAKTAVSAAQALAPSAALSGLRTALDQIAPGSSPGEVDTLLPGSAEQILDEALARVVTASDTQLETINSLARSGSGSGSGTGTSGGSGTGSGGATTAVITATTPVNYLWATLEEGQPAYVDRAYTFTVVPARFQGLRYLQTANGDKGSTSATAVSFSTDKTLTVYVAHDAGISPKPIWLADWSDTGEQLVTTDTTLHLFEKSLGPGAVTLGGNGGTSSNSMYSVVIGTIADTDGDGMPDAWEAANGLDPATAADAAADTDGDGRNNLQEYQAGSDPQVADSGPSNSPPTIAGAPTPEVVVGHPYSFAPTTSDPEGDDLTFTITNKPNWANFDPATGALTGIPTAADARLYSGIVIAVSDGASAASLAPFDINVVQIAAGSATISWTPPTTSEDGSALTDLAGYKLYYGTSPGTYPNVTVISNPGLSSYVVGNLAPATYYFVLTAFDNAGNESEHSNVASKTIN